MGIETLVYIGIAAGLSYISGKLLSKPQSSKIKAEAPTLSTRGSYTNFIRGRQKVSPLFAWAGKRTSGKHDDVRYYYEKGWLILGIGPATRLLKIWRDGKVLWEAGIESSTTPSGSYVSIGKRKINGFWIYWGENNQPLDTNLNEWLEIDSRWPKIFYALMNKVELTTGRWPEFTFEVVCHGPTPSGTDGLQNSTRIHTDYSMNPAHLIWELLYMAYPDGCGISASNLDKPSFEVAGVLLQNEGSWCNLLCTDGETATEAISRIMEDFGLLLSQRGDKLSLTAVRDIAYALKLDYDQLMPPLPELEFNLTTRSSNQLIFAYSDMENDYSEMDVKVDDDGNAFLRTNSEKIELATITSRDVANQISERKAQEKLVGPIKYKLNVNRAGRSLRTGDAVYVPGIGKMRVVSHELDTLSAKTTIEVLVDLYGIELSGYLNGAFYPGITGEGATLKDDVNFGVVEMWRESDNAHLKEIRVLRLRREESSTFSNILVSFDDGVTYANIFSSKDVVTGGKLLQAIDEKDDFIINQGPTFTIYNTTDILDIEDLSTDNVSWLSGQQLCLINDEIFYIQKVTAISTNVYRLDGLARARFDTIRASHAIGSYVYIFNKNDNALIYDERFNRGKTIWIKPQPKTEDAVLDEDGIVPKSLEITWRGIDPLSPKNVRVNSGILYQDSQNFVITWTIRKMIDGLTGAGLSGMQISGTAILDATATRDGKFRVELRETWGFPRISVEVDSDIFSTTILWADIETAFGAILPNEMDIAVIDILNENESEPCVQRIRKEIS